MFLNLIKTWVCAHISLGTKPYSLTKLDSELNSWDTCLPWSIMVHHGPSWSIMVHHGPSWSICISKLVPPCAHLKQSQWLRPSRQWTFAIDRSPGFVCTNSKYFHWLRGTFFLPLKFLISAWCFLPSLAWILLEWQRLETTAVSQHLHISELLKSTYSERAHFHCKRDILPVQLKSSKIRTDVNFWLHLRDILLLELVEAPLQVWHACISLLASRLL